MSHRKTRNIDFPILIVVLFFMVISCLSIYSAMTYLPSYLGNLALKQFIFYGIGFLLLFGLFQLSKNFYKKSVFYFYIAGNILLLTLLFFGKDVNGSKCWFILPGLGSFQPSEFMKIILILEVSKLTDDFFERFPHPSFKEEFIFLCKILGVVFIPSILTFLEPDTGAVIIYLLITVGILLVSPLRRRWFGISFILVLLMMALFFYLYFFQQDLFVDILGTDLFYRIDRVLDWQKGEGLQLENALTAIGSSGIFGHGYNRTPLYFPEAGTDFIFAVFASNFGLVGSLLLLGFHCYFDIHLLRMAKGKKDTFCKYVIIGAVSMFFYQQIQNISMTFGLLPITGITLPFISYGGSSLIAYLSIIGIILNLFSYRQAT